MEIEELKSSLAGYQSQLSQVEEAINSQTDSGEIESLTTLKLDLLELINLTLEQIDKLVSDDAYVSSTNSKNNINEYKKENVIDNEYALFMAEMEKSGAYEKSTTEESSNDADDTDFKNDFTSLEGTQCSVLFSHNWGGAPSSYNAMVCSVIKDNIDISTKYDDIKVRIMFTNPTSLEMVPCPYYLEGECKFDEHNCRFSHGEIVPLSSLKEAIQPNFESLKIGSRVLAKIKKNELPMSNKQSEKYLLWHRAVIKSVNLEKHICKLKLENDVLFTSGKANDYEVEFGHIFPLTDDSVNSDFDSDSSSDSEILNDFENLPGTSTSSTIIEQSLSNNDSSVKLGEWEKYTKGIGSKLMMKMGYIVGTGLGPEGEGRINPVPCRVTPSGRSLDHCMKLREEANNEDPLKVEKRLRRLEKKKEDQERKAYERLKNREKHDVFNFLNSTLSKSTSDNIECDKSNKNNQKLKEITDIKSSSCKTLNIEQFKLAEDIKKTEKDIIKLKNSMIRNVKDSSVHKGLSVQLTSKLEEIDMLKKRQTSISNEQNNRKDKRKLTIF